MNNKMIIICNLNRLYLNEINRNNKSKNIQIQRNKKNYHKTNNKLLTQESKEEEKPKGKVGRKKKEGTTNP